MPTTPDRPGRQVRTPVSITLTPELAMQLFAFCEERVFSPSAVVEIALKKLLSPPANGEAATVPPTPTKETTKP